MAVLDYALALWIATSGVGDGSVCPSSMQSTDLAQMVDSVQVREPAADAASHEETIASLAERIMVLELLLEEIRSEDRGVEEQVDRMPELAGYLDFEYVNDSRGGSYQAFRQHHLSLMPSQEQGDFRVFAEIEFEYGASFEGDGEGNEQARGCIVVEQAWVEYTQADYLTVRGGNILTPGYWNIHHHTHTTLSTRTPLLVGGVYPSRTIGIMVYGTSLARQIGITYNAYLGNGEETNPGKLDTDENKAFGGRLVLHGLPGEALDQIDFGVSGYAEHLNSGDETRIWGFDTQLALGPVRVLGEFARRVGAEGRRGVYLQPSVHLGMTFEPFYRYDLYRLESGSQTEEHTFGILARPVAFVALKLEGYRSIRPDTKDYNGVATSVAVAF